MGGTKITTETWVEGQEEIPNSEVDREEDTQGHNVVEKDKREEVIWPNLKTPRDNLATPSSSNSQPWTLLPLIKLKIRELL